MIWPFKKRETGFTLIELMVVLIIISLLASLVAPAIFKRIEKAEISAEEKKLASIFESAKIISFARRTPVVIKLENNILTIMNTAREPKSSTGFQFFLFEKDLVRYNANGFCDQKDIKYICDNRERILSLEK